MTILNIMLGAKRGGLEQAAIDYAEAMHHAGIAHHTVVAPGGWAHQQIAALGLPHSTLKQRGGWDLLAAWRLTRLAKTSNAQALICVGNRALSLGLLACTKAPKIAVAQNYKTRRFHKADACFAITRHAKETLEQKGIAPARVHFLPNMARVGDTPVRPALRTPPVIGSMGRFVAKKAFDVYLDALAQLKDRGIAFRAVLGGGGDDEAALRERIARLELEEHVALPGWVTDKHAFFAGIDIFVLPSHHEPFGIVFIEAMADGVPVLSTLSEGPREVLTTGTDGILTPLADATAMADGLEKMLANPAATQAMGMAGYQTVRTHYSLEAMAQRLKIALNTIITGN